MSEKEVPPVPGPEYDSLRNLGGKEHEKGRNRSTTSPSGRNVYSSYHPTSSSQTLDSQRYIKPFSISQSHLLPRDEEAKKDMPPPPIPPSQLAKTRKNSSVPKLTIKKVTGDDIQEAYSAPPMTPASSFASKFGRGRSKSKIPSATEPPTPTTTDTIRELSSSLPSSQDTNHSAKFGSESAAPSASETRPATRSSSTDGRISSKFKASKNAIAHQGQKWSQKGQGLFGKLKGRSEPVKVAPVKSTKPTIDIFGMKLDEAVNKTRVVKSREETHDVFAYWTPALVYRSIQYLNKYGPDEVGLYRVPGSTAAVDELSNDFKIHYDVNLLENRPNDIATVASMLKAYIRVLPDPILPVAMQRSIFELCKSNTDASTPPKAFVDELSKLPPHNYYLLQSLTKHLHTIHKASDINKMGLSNLAMVFCSTLRMDRYIFNWLVSSPSLCWAGCLTEDEDDSAVHVQLKNNEEKARPETALVGLGIGEIMKPVTSREIGRKNSTSPVESVKQRNRSSRVFDHNTIISYNLQESDRGRKRDSRELGVPNGGNRHKRTSGDSVSSLDTQAFGTQGSQSTKPTSPRHDTFDTADLTRNFKLDARTRRSVDLSTILTGTQNSGNATPPFDQPTRYNTATPLSSGYGKSPISSSARKDNTLKPSSSKGELPPSPLPRSASADRVPTKANGAGLLPPMPPISPLMAGNNQYGNF